jgi:hypothetical protein
MTPLFDPHDHELEELVESATPLLPADLRDRDFRSTVANLELRLAIAQEALEQEHARRMTYEGRWTVVCAIGTVIAGGIILALLVTWLGEVL